MSLANSRDSEKQGSLAYCSPQGRKESDITKRLNKNNNNTFLELSWGNKSWSWKNSNLNVRALLAKIEDHLLYSLLWFPGGSLVRNLPASAGETGDVGSIPGLGRSPGGGNGNPVQCSCLEKSHGQRSLVGYGPQGHRESAVMEHTYTNKTHNFFGSSYN